MLASRPAAPARAPTIRALQRDPIRVFVVDDSSVVRSFITRLLQAEADIDVVGTAGDGEAAVRKLRDQVVDVVILDVEMPVLDGLAALPQILARGRLAPKVVMASTLTHRGAAISMQALVKGASDYVPKPTSMASDGAAGFGRDLVEKIRVWGSLALRERRPSPASTTRAAPAAVASLAKPASATRTIPAAAAPRPAAVPLRGLAPEALAVGCSTGGPQALLKLFNALRDRPLGPVFVTQHMPPTFTAMFAEQLARASGRVCHEVIDDEPALPGAIHLAPGDWHMVVEQRGGVVRVRRTQTPPENYCRPSVDPMFRSLASIYKDRLLALILTGMGHDGLEGSRVVTQRGGRVLAQDEASSVVWGMPGAVSQAGLASEQLPVEQLAERVTQLFGSVA
jgi:two-component system chemotaxis response regulator CheB